MQQMYGAKEIFWIIYSFFLQRFMQGFLYPTAHEHINSHRKIVCKTKELTPPYRFGKMRSAQIECIMFCLDRGLKFLQEWKVEIMKKFFIARSVAEMLKFLVHILEKQKNKRTFWTTAQFLKWDVCERHIQFLLPKRRIILKVAVKNKWFTQKRLYNMWSVFRS